MGSLIFSLQPAAGATRTWNGGGSSDDTSLAANWGGAAPGAGDLLHFAGTIRLTPNQVAALSIGSLTFDSGAGAFTLGGNTYTISTAAGITNSSTNTQTINNAITLGIAQTWSASSGNLALGGNIVNGGFLLTIGGSFSTSASAVISGAGGLTLNGGGKLTLSGAGANTYGGATSVNDGELDLSKNSGKNAYAGTLTIGDGVGAAGSAITKWLVANQAPATAVTVNSDGLMNLNGFSDAIGTLTMTTGSVSTGAGTLTIGGDLSTNAASTSATIAGNLGISANRKFTVADGSAAVDLLVSANITGAHSLTKEGTGTLVLSGTNGINDLLLNAGVVNLQNSGALGTATPTVAAGAALQVQGGLSFTNALTLNGSGISSDGALRNISGSNTFSGTVTLASDTTVGTDAGTLTLSGVISGAGFALTKVGAGTLTYGGAGNNTYTGATIVNEGTLILSKTAGHTAIAGALTVGDGSGTDVVQLAVANEIGNVAITVNSSGTLDLNGFADTIGALNMTGGSVTTGAGTLTLGGTVTGSAFSSSATITGNLALGANRIFDIADGSASTDMLVSALVTGAFSVTKTGNGTLVFSNANTYTGTTTVNAGDLSISTFAVTTAGKITIAAGATLTSTGVLNLTPTNSAQTNISGAGTLRLRNSSSTAGSPDIYYDPTGGNGVGYGITIASNVDVGTGTRFINGKSNYNDFVNWGGDLIFGGSLSGSANLTFTGTPYNGQAGGPWQMAYVFQGNNSSFSGGVTLTDGANLILSNNNALSSANAVTFTPATGAVSGLYLYGRSVTIGALSGTAAGTMNIRNGSRTTDATAQVLNSNSILTVQQNSNTTFNGIISDGPNDVGVGNTGTYYTLGLIKSGPGSLTLSGTNTYTGGTTINGGALVVNSAASLGATSGGLTINAGTLEVATGYSTTRSITLGDVASTFQVDAAQTFTDTTAIGGTGSLTKTGSGTMVLGAAETYGGSTNVSAGTLQLNASNRVPDASALTVSGGAFDVQTFSETVAGVTLSGGSITGSGAGTLTGSSYALQSGSASAILAGSGAVTKSTSGTVTLTGNNTMTGAVTVNAGTLTLAASSGSALGSTTAVTVNSGGTLLLGANDQINNSATMTLAGGTLAKGNFSEGTTGSVGIGALTLSATGSHIDFGTGTVGTLTFASLSAGANTLLIDNWTGTYNTVGNAGTDRLIFDSDQSSNLSAFSFTGFGAGATEFSLGGGYWEVTALAPVPEPSTWVAGGLAFCLLAYHLTGRRIGRSRLSQLQKGG